MGACNVSSRGTEDFFCPSQPENSLDAGRLTIQNRLLPQLHLHFPMQRLLLHEFCS